VDEAGAAHPGVVQVQRPELGHPRKVGRPRVGHMR
jgi:hypothetical protein